MELIENHGILEICLILFDFHPDIDTEIRILKHRRNLKERGNANNIR